MENSGRKPSRLRALARHEVELWEQVTRHVKPLRPLAHPSRARDEAEESAKPVVALPPTSSAPVKSGAHRLKPLVPLEPTVLRRLSRGRGAPEAKIDLHGMRQAEAHAALRAFLHEAHGAGVRLVLVVTGKGKPNPAGMYSDERGVLRRSLPHWLAAPDLRSIVLGFEEAGRRHGGEGALYVRLRGANMSRNRWTT